MRPRKDTPKMLEDTAMEDEVTYCVLVKKGRKHFAPQLVSAGTTTATWIFPVRRYLIAIPNKHRRFKNGFITSYAIIYINAIV
jgi:hypothetical protein